jgi:F1F0 ATPase subunit 2
MLRLGATVIIFYLIMDGHWERLLACTVGFLAARTLLIRRLQPQKG